MKKSFFNSLIFKIGIVILAVEIIALVAAGFIYINRFSKEVDRRVEANIQIPGTLIASGLLNYEAVSDQQILEDLVGQGLIDGMIIGANQNVFHSLNPTYIGENIANVPDLDPTWFDHTSTQSFVVRITDGPDIYLASITPIIAQGSENPFLFAYIKADTSQAEQDKANIFQLFALVSAGIVVATSIVIILLFNFLVSSRINKLVGALSQVEAGDLGARVSGPNSADEIGFMTQTFNDMASQLQGLVNSLEERVERRTNLLQTSAEVGQRISDILDVETLLTQVTNLVQENFNYYHVQVFFLDDNGYLVTKAGAGITGTQMVSQGYRLQQGGKSLVGQAGLGTEQIANDVSKSPHWHYNQLLPETRAELALPLEHGSQVIGVLDVQSNEVNAFSDQEVTMMRLIADQLTIAIGNARLFQETDRTRKETEVLVVDLQQVSQDLGRRNRQLQTAAEVSKAANTILDTQALMQEVVNRIKTGFDFYYVGLFLVDANKKWAVLRAGTGEAGEQQRISNHRLQVGGTSMIGWATSRGEARIALDVSSEEVHFVNKYLPETRSEMALPLINQGNILGALSIQSTIKDAFSNEDIGVLQTMADQIAIALQNARLFSEAEASRERFYDLYNRAPAGYHTLSRDGIFLEINDTELQMLGYQDQRENLIHKRHMNDFLAKESQPKFEEALSKIIKGKSIRNLELVYIRKDGRPMTVITTASPVLNQAGEVAEIYTSVQDISLLKAAQAARETLLNETNTLYKLGQQLLSAESQEEIYEASLNAVRSANPRRGIGILMYNQMQGQINLELVALWNNPDLEWPSVKVGDSFPAGALGIDELLVSGNTIISPNIHEDEQFSEPLRMLLSGFHIMSLVGVPIWNRGNVVGFILISHHTTEPFSSDAVRLFEGVSRQLSVNIEKLALLQEAQQRANQLEAAAEVSKNTTSVIDLDVLLPQTVELIKDVFDYYHVSIFLVDDYKQHAILEAATGEIGQQQRQHRLRLAINKDNLVGTSITEEKVRINLNVSPERLQIEQPLLPDTSAEVALPLIVRGEVIGALDVQTTKDRPFNQGDVVVLQTIGDQLANAIYVARLFARERAASQEIQELHQQYLQSEWNAFLQAGDTDGKRSYLVAENSNWGDIIDHNFSDWFSGIIDNVDKDVSMQAYPVPAANGNESADEGDHLSILTNALTLRDQVIGSLGFIDKDARQWTDDEQEILKAVSAQATLAIENARLVEETQKRAQQLQISAEISEDIIAILDQDLLLFNSVRQIASRFGFSRAYYYVVDTRPKLLYRSQDAEASKEPKPLKVVVGPDTLAGQALAQEEIVIIQEGEEQFLPAISAQFSDTHAAIAIPLAAGKGISGILEIHCRWENMFTDNLVAVLEILGSQIATSLQNARAYREEQQTTEKLREIDRLKTQFLANMSHELRTPLNSIIGFSRVILKGIDGPLTELQKSDLGSIYQSGQHLLGLINDILDLAKIEAGKLDLIFTEIDPNQMLHGVCSTATGLVKDKPIKIIQDIPENLPSLVGDEIRLRQVLINLISNATKFTEEGTITISASTDNQDLNITVADTGIGIPEDEVEAIFDEFTQVDSSTTRKAGGTGLGLPITKKFIELHHGRIFVRSKVNYGSSFTVQLPLKPQQDKELEEAPPEPELKISPEINQQPIILAVDDDPQVLKLYERYLRNKPMELVGLSDSMQAVSQAKELQPFAILLDVLMPEKDGWRVISELKENPYTTHIPIIICSIVDDKYKANSLDVAGYLTKPILEKDLLDALETLSKHPRTKRVLIIDDHADDILLSRRILEARACQVIEASSGPEGLEIVYNYPPDLIILDLTMPGMDGFEVMDTLKNDVKIRSIPVIVITARDLNASEREKISQHADALLTKGRFLDSDLLKYVDQILQPEFA